MNVESRKNGTDEPICKRCRCREWTVDIDGKGRVGQTGREGLIYTQFLSLTFLFFHCFSVWKHSHSSKYIYLFTMFLPRDFHFLETQWENLAILRLLQSSFFKNRFLACSRILNFILFKFWHSPYFITMYTIWI